MGKRTNLNRHYPDGSATDYSFFCLCDDSPSQPKRHFQFSAPVSLQHMIFMRFVKIEWHFFKAGKSSTNWRLHRKKCKRQQLFEQQKLNSQVVVQRVIREFFGQFGCAGGKGRRHHVKHQFVKVAEHTLLFVEINLGD